MASHIWHLMAHNLYAKKRRRRRNDALPTPSDNTYVCIVNENVKDSVGMFLPHHRDAFVNSNPL